MKNLIVSIILPLTLISYAALGQQPWAGVEIDTYNLRVDNDMVDIDMGMAYDRTVIGANEQLTITPMLVKGRDTLILRPVVFTGDTRAAVNSRELRLNNARDEGPVPYEDISFSRREIRQRKAALESPRAATNRADRIDYHVRVPYRAWMNEATLVLKEEFSDCQNTRYPYYTFLDEVRRPVMASLHFIVPEIEQVKARSLEMTSHVNFEQDKHIIRYDIANNARELEKIYDFTSEVLDNDEIEVSSIKIKGFASPEATYSYNDRLSAQRVAALRDDLARRFNLDRDVFVIENVPEDWDSLRGWIASSDLQYRDQLLSIIDNTPDPDARDGKIRALDAGRTYNRLLSEVYPQLRRVDYAIDYTVLPFTVERGREVILTEPHNMSLNELYMVALSYPHDSEDYVRCFDTMIRHYPDDAVACNNRAAAALRSGDLQTARIHLERVKDDPRCKNNIGVLLLREGKRDQAEEWFRQAALEGIPEAQHNLENLLALY